MEKHFIIVPHELLKKSNIEIELSIEKYKEKNMDRDLVIVGRKE